MAEDHIPCDHKGRLWPWARGQREVVTLQPPPEPKPTQIELDELYTRLAPVWINNRRDQYLSSYTDSFAVETRQEGYLDRPTLAEDIVSQANWIRDTRGLGEHQCGNWFPQMTVFHTAGVGEREGTPYPLSEPFGNPRPRPDSYIRVMQRQWWFKYEDWDSWWWWSRHTHAPRKIVERCRWALQGVQQTLVPQEQTEPEPFNRYPIQYGTERALKAQMGLPPDGVPPEPYFWGRR